MTCIRNTDAITCGVYHGDILLICVCLDGTAGISSDTLATALNSPNKVRYFGAASLIQLSHAGYLLLFNTETLNMILTQIDNQVLFIKYCCAMIV